ncbi:MAG TPA: hypothetical protein VF793_06000, partial [Telluria sp.]
IWNKRLVYAAQAYFSTRTLITLAGVAEKHLLPKFNLIQQCAYAYLFKNNNLRTEISDSSVISVVISRR